MSDPLLPLLQCPRCRRSALAAIDDGYECQPCGLHFPRLDGVPWLYADPDAAIAGWRNRSTLYLEEFAAEARRANGDLVGLPPGSPTAARVRRLAEAYADHGRRVAALLAPLGLGRGAMPHATQVAFRTELPATQDLHSYHANVHRDWAWGEEENAASHAVVAAALEDARGSMLVLGAGAGRLAYDLHVAARTDLTVALDINPLLLAVARRAAMAEPVELYEFPIAPLDAAHAAVLRRLCAPAAVRDGLVFVAADAWRAPFAPQSFDAVITPWFVDIVDVEFPALAAHVNRLLRPGGRWVNFGSLAFPWRRPALRWTLDEVLAIVADSGFDVRSSANRRLPYLRSPASRHARVETVAVFAADKTRRGPREADEPAPPAWLADTTLPVPRTAELDLQGTAARIHAVLLALVDGHRSIDEIAAIVSSQGLLDATEARVATRALLERLHATAASGGPRVT
jgi:ubiquinone/menaquinone biosynthesis C-methylase UbiE/uncharacterized protein YbaR (Trm112 family)